MRLCFVNLNPREVWQVPRKPDKRGAQHSVLEFEVIPSRWIFFKG
jgi:hypothetical protein